MSTCKHTYCPGCVSIMFSNATKNEASFPPKCCGQEISLKEAACCLHRPQIRPMNRAHGTSRLQTPPDATARIQSAPPFWDVETGTYLDATGVLISPATVALGMHILVSAPWTTNPSTLSCSASWRRRRVGSNVLPAEDFLTRVQDAITSR